MIANGNTYCKIANLRLPITYQEIEYIEGTGEQWIDTNLLFNDNTQYIIEFTNTVKSYPTSHRQHIVGTYLSGNRYRISTDDISPRYIFYLYGSNTYVQVNININRRIKIVLSFDSITIYEDNKQKYRNSFQTTFSQNNKTIGLFQESGKSYGYFIGKIYYFTAYEGNTLVRKMIPCYRKSDGEVGMYDVVNNVFYTNQGTGSFVKGSDVAYNITNIERPYIKGHITNSDSTLTFTVNGNESVTVPVDNNGNWKWIVDRPITSFLAAFENKTNIDELYLCKIDLSIDCQHFFAKNGTSTFHIIDISKCLPITSGNFSWFTAASKCIVYLPKIKYPINSFLSSMTQVFATKNIYANIDIATSNGLIKENVLSIIKYMMGNYTIRLSSTIYNKCASGGEWYTDIQAAINAKALEGYTVTLISA